MYFNNKKLKNKIFVLEKLTKIHFNLISIKNG